MNKLNKSKTGIVSYGAYIPKYRITVEEIAKTWGNDPESYKNGLGLIEKSVPGLDEDTATISVNAAFQAKSRLLKSADIGAVFVGSESHPYAVKPTAGIVGEAICRGNNWTASDTEFACKAGSVAIQMVCGLVESGRIDYGLAIGADTAQGAPGDALEFSAAAGGAAYIIGNENVIAELVHTTSFTSDTPDFWRREREKFPKHGGRFTGEPAYFKHVSGSVKQLLKETDYTIDKFDHVVFHMPNGKFPIAVAKYLGVNDSQMKYGFIVPNIGNTYSACSLLGFASVLDNAQPGELVLLTSYGSGAGSDSFVFKITENILKYRENYKKFSFDKTIEEYTKRKDYLSYGQYVLHTKKLIGCN